MTMSRRSVEVEDGRSWGTAARTARTAAVPHHPIQGRNAALVAPSITRLIVVFLASDGERMLWDDDEMGPDAIEAAAGRVRAPGAVQPRRRCRGLGIEGDGAVSCSVGDVGAVVL